MKLNFASSDFMEKTESVVSLHKIRGVVITMLLFLCVMVLPSMTDVPALAYTNGEQVNVGYYTYTFDTTKQGWHVRVIGTTETTYGLVLSSYGGYPVKSMGAGIWGGSHRDATFSRCKALTTLPSNFTIPDTVINVSYLFSNCTNLTTLPTNFTIPNGVTDVISLFSNCTNLTYLPTNFTIPEGVTTAYCCFYNCTNLFMLPIRFTIPNSVTNANSFFFGCSNLSGVVKVLTTAQVGVDSATASAAAGKLTLNYVNASTATTHQNALTGSGIKKVVATSNFNGQQVNVGDYTYTFDTTERGWHVRATNIIKTTYGLVTSPYGGYPVKSMGDGQWGGKTVNGTFYGCANLTTLHDDFVIPDSVTNTSSFFNGCSKLSGTVNVSIFTQIGVDSITASDATGKLFLKYTNDTYADAQQAYLDTNNISKVVVLPDKKKPEIISIAMIVA